MTTNLSGYLTDTEDDFNTIMNNIINDNTIDIMTGGLNNKTKTKKYRKRRSKSKNNSKKNVNNNNSKKNSNDILEKNTEYTDSIYYNTKNFDDIANHLLQSNLLSNTTNTIYSNTTNSNIDKSINNTFNKITKSETNISKQEISSVKPKTTAVSITVYKSNVNGKTNEAAKIIYNNSNSKYIKEYIYHNGKKQIKLKNKN